MKKTWTFDAEAAKNALAAFFGKNHQQLSDYGSTVNQVFEASVFSRLIEHYRDRGWVVDLVHPGGKVGSAVKLKFSTRGRPSNYTYARATHDDHPAVQIRHGLRVATAHHEPGASPPANIVLDVPVILDVDLAAYKSEDFLDNASLVTFGEAKHMSAYAELVAGFIGLVHEMQPGRLAPKAASTAKPDHPPAFLYVSGVLYHTGRGLKLSIERRELDIAIFSSDFPMTWTTLATAIPSASVGGPHITTR